MKVWEEIIVIIMYATILYYVIGGATTGLPQH